MSSKPDGTDPRILQPEGTTVFMASTTRQSKARKYHKEGCDDLDMIKGEPHEKDIAIAKWKGYEKCANCYGGENEPNHDLTGKDVDRIRRALVSGYVSCPDIATCYPVESITIRYHAKHTRDYTYQTEPSKPSVRHNGQTWVYDE